jgi:hypothetical protein
MFIVQVEVQFFNGDVTSLPLDAFDSKVDAQKFIQEHQARSDLLMKCMLVRPTSAKKSSLAEGVNAQLIMAGNEFMQTIGIKGWNYRMVSLEVRSPIEAPPSGLIIPAGSRN